MVSDKSKQFFFSSMFQPRVFILLRRCLFDSDDEVCYIYFWGYTFRLYINTWHICMSIDLRIGVWLWAFFCIFVCVPVPLLSCFVCFSFGINLIVLVFSVLQNILNSFLFSAISQVRDRATLYLNTLGGDGSVVETDSDVKDFLFGSLDVPLVNLETSLKNYVSNLHLLFPFFPLRSLSHVFRIVLMPITGGFRRTFWP